MILLRFHTVVRTFCRIDVLVSVLNRHVLILFLSPMPLSVTPTDSYPWVCGLVSAVDFAFLYMATDTVLGSHLLFERVPFMVMDAAALVSGVLSFVMEHVCQTCPRTSWVDFRWRLSTTRRMER